MIPEGWNEVELSDATSKPISYGIVQTGEKGTGTIPCVRVVDLTRPKLNRKDMITTTEEINRSYKKTILEIGEIMFALRGEIGAVQIVDDQLEGCNLTRGIARLSLKKTITHPEFLLYQIQSQSVHNEIARRVNGSALKELPIGELRRIPVSLPPLAEQKKIAEILGTWDKAIEVAEKQLDNAKTQKRALMQQLLTGKRRFPKFEGQEWVETRLRDHCDLKGGFGFPEIYQGDTSGEIPFIKVSDMNLEGNEILIQRANNWLSEKLAGEIRVKPFPENATVFAKVGAALMLNRRRILSRPTIIDNNMMAAIPNPNTNAEYLYHFFTRIDLGRLAQVGAVPSINQTELGAMKVRFPAIEEQSKITEVLNQMDREIKMLRSKLTNLRTEKNALMQQLLIGKKRVKV